MNTKKSFDANQLKLIHSRFKNLREETETNEKKLSHKENSANY